MKIIRGSQEWKKSGAGLAVAIGNFDGVHRGHQAILKDLIQTAKKKKWQTAVYTFDPHPAKILSPETAPSLIQTVSQKTGSLAAMGVDAAIIETFDEQFSNLSPEQFLKEILLNRLEAKGVWIGYDFTFGHQRKGNAETLKSFCREHNIQLKIMEPQFCDKTLVNSTQIRRLIAEGKVAAAAKFLGRPFALTGVVEKGHGIGGGKLGIHTANLKLASELLPKTGIYITHTEILDGSSKKGWPSATSVGFNPTFPGKGFSVETHLIGFKGNLLGKEIEVAFLEWLRDELTFPNEETLATQIEKDIARTLQYYKDHPQ